MDKQRAILEERRNRWMADREATLARESQQTGKPSAAIAATAATLSSSSQRVPTKPTASASPSMESQLNRPNQRSTYLQSYESNSSTNHNPLAVSTSTNASDDDFIDKLTQKLARNIRDEVKKELAMTTHSTEVRDVIAEQMNSYLSAELGTHTCKICNNLMVSPHHTPVLLFPCGHTFCQTCCDSHRRKYESIRAAFTCPYCRSEVQSIAVNQSLKDLIDQFSKQRSMISNPQSHLLEEIFPVPPPQGEFFDGRASFSSAFNDAWNRGKDYGYRAGSSGPVDMVPNKYAAQLRNCEVRKEILQNELEEARKDLAVIDKRHQSLRQASAHLLSERDSVEEKIKQFIEERDLIDKHLTVQQSRQQELEGQLRQCSGKVDTISQSIQSIQTEMEKLEILSQSQAVSQPSSAAANHRGRY